MDNTSSTLREIFIQLKIKKGWLTDSAKAQVLALKSEPEITVVLCASTCCPKHITELYGRKWQHAWFTGVNVNDVVYLNYNPNIPFC